MAPSRPPMKTSGTAMSTCHSRSEEHMQGWGSCCRQRHNNREGCCQRNNRGCNAGKCNADAGGRNVYSTWANGARANAATSSK